MHPFYVEYSIGDVGFKVNKTSTINCGGQPNVSYLAHDSNTRTRWR